MDNVVLQFQAARSPGAGRSALGTSGSGALHGDSAARVCARPMPEGAAQPRVNRLSSGDSVPCGRAPGGDRVGEEEVTGRTVAPRAADLDARPVGWSRKAE